MHMKNVFLIEKSPDVFRAVKAYLEESDIQYVKFSSLDEALQSEEVPALIILFTTNSYEDIKHDIDALINNAAFSRIPRILLLPFNTSVSESKIRELDVHIQALFQIPVEKLKFLTSVAHLLIRAPRRVFRILITLQPEGSKIRYSGTSIDFSESGMAFESSADFQPGDLLQVQFVNPGSRKRFLLKARLIRRVVTGSTIFYGIKFIETNEQNEKELLNFITGENKA